MAIDAAEAARLVPRVEQWLDTPAQWQLPFKTQELVAHLVNGGQFDAGIELLRSLINAARVERDRYLGAELIRGATAAMFPAAGVAGLEVVADLLADALDGDHEDRNDFSNIWRPYLNGVRRRDLRDALVSALRDGADEIVSADPPVSLRFWTCSTIASRRSFTGWRSICSRVTPTPS
jgi:hypothetical protein